MKARSKASLNIGTINFYAISCWLTYHWKVILSPFSHPSIRTPSQTNNWAAHEILTPAVAKQRKAVIQQLVAVAQECFRMNNYPTMFQFVAALTSAAVQRLQRTWELVPKKVFATTIITMGPDLFKIMDVLGQYTVQCTERSTLVGRYSTCIGIWSIRRFRNRMFVTN